MSVQAVSICTVVGLGLIILNQYILKDLHFPFLSYVFIRIVSFSVCNFLAYLSQNRLRKDYKT